MFMAKPLSILFVSSEVFPFAKESGISGISYSLPLAIRDYGHDIRVMVPKYGSISERKNRIHEINRLRDIPIPLGTEEEPVTVKSSSINNPRVKVQAYITTNFKYFDSRKGYYNDPVTWEEYPDNAERFIFFNRSVVETCMLLGWYPDIIHCNDWHAAMIPAYLKRLFAAKFKKTKTVLTIHNFDKQGSFDLDVFNKSGLPADVMPDFRHKNKFNFLKGGILNADYINTVSPEYADAILSAKTHSERLNSVLKERSDKFSGIMCGIDHWTWGPKTDANIHSKFGHDIEEFKYNNKVALINKVEFEYDPKKMLVGLKPRLETSEEIDLLLEALPELFKLDAQFVLLGEGYPDIKNKFIEIEKNNPRIFRNIFVIDENTNHQLEAGADITISLNKLESTGLNVMHSMLYGAPPVAYNSGAVKDFAKEFSSKSKAGNAFLFNKYTVESLMQSMNSAISTFKNKESWLKLVENCMESDFTLGESAKKYDEIYRSLMKE